MPTTFERRQTVIRLLGEKPGIKVTELAAVLDVSEGTIRNDLNALEAEKQIRRVRGGAILIDQLDFPAQQPPIANLEAKRRIGHWAAEMVDDGDAIWLDAGTTAQMIIPHLKERGHLTIVTNGLHVALRVAESTDHTVLLIGGKVESGGLYTAGSTNQNLLDYLRLRTAFISGVGFTVEAGLMARAYEDARLKEKVLQQAEQVVALVDSSKIGRSGFSPFAATEQIDYLVTDSEVPPEMIQQLHRNRVNLIVCGQNSVRSYSVPTTTAQYTIGFANLSEDLPFAVAVRRGLERAAALRSNIDLVIVDNKLSGAEALRLADHLINRGVDLAIEYQIDYRTGNLLMDKFHRAGVPVIAVDIPMVGATFFGVDNYRAGLDGGQAFGRALQETWDGVYDYLLVLEEPRAGSLPAARIQGQLDGVSEILGPIPPEKLIFLDSGNTVQVSEAEVTRALQAHPTARRVGVLSFNTDAALGALRAARRLDREEHVLIVGQGADRLLLNEIRQPGSRVIGSTTYMPQNYGSRLIDIAVKILKGESVPPAVYIEHQFVTRENIDEIYPAG